MPAIIAELNDSQKNTTILSLCYSDGLLGAAIYNQKASTVRILHDTGENDEFKIISLLFDQVEPNIVLLCKSQDLNCVRYLSEKCKSEQDTVHPVEENTYAESSVEVYQPSEIAEDDVVADSQDPTNIQEESDDAEESFDPFKDATLHLMPSNAYRFDQAVARIGELFSSEVLSKCEADLILQFRLDTKAVNMVRAFGALLRYMDAARIGVEYDTMNIRTPISAIKTFVLDKMVEIDYSTYRALEIFCEDKKKEIGWRKALKLKGAGGVSLFSLMNRCRSPLGKHTLMNWFGHPTLNRETLRNRQKAISFFVQDCNADIMSFIHQSLGKIRNIKMVLKRMCGALIKPSHWKNLHESLKSLLAIGKCLTQKEINLDIMNDYDSFLKGSVTEAAFLLNHIVDIESSIAEGRLVANALIDTDLDELKIVYKGLPQLLTRIAQEEASRLGAEHCSVGYVPIVGYILSLPIDFPASIFTDLKMVYTADDRAHFKSKRMNTLDEQVGDIKMQIVDKETTIALRLQRSILEKSDVILEAYRAAATLDAIISMAMTARQFGWNCPTLTHHPVIEASRSIHPLTQMLSPDRVFVPNDICLGGNDTKVKIFTGPNACGKSVYMKQVAILSFLAHIGSFVPAQKALIGPINRILTRVYTVDGVLDGMSTFAKDLQQLALALRRANQYSLVIIDEFGKGTLTEVGLSLLSSSINYWLTKGRNNCPHLLVSSHFHALPKFLLNDNDELSFHTFEVIKRGNRLDYQFRLVDGLIDCSHAAYTAAQMGIPDDVVKRSNEIYTALRDGAHSAELMIPNVMQSKYEFLAEHMGRFLQEFLSWNVRADHKRLLTKAEELLLDDSEEMVQDASFIANCSMHTPHELHSDDGSPTMHMIESNATIGELTEEANVDSEETPQEGFKKPTELSGHTSSDPTLCSVTITEEQIFEIPSSVTSSILKHRFKSVTRENLSVSFAASPVRVRSTRDTPLVTRDEFMRPPSPIKRFTELFPSDDGDVSPLPEKRKKIA